MALALTGHLGVQVADLIDGRLPAHVEERAWQHVMACAGCRSRVEAEGWAKDRIRELQEARRRSGFDISDRIRVRMEVPAARREWADRHAELIAGEVLATDFAVVDALDPTDGEALDFAEGVRVTLARV